MFLNIYILQGSVAT